MKLSNTMIMNETLLPNSKKAFTLAEVLITLSILGVVAALTIPSLVNRQSELAAIVKMKKAVSQYEQVVEVYMAENDATTFDVACADLDDYFKVVTGANSCDFTTADGVHWVFGNGESGKGTIGNAVAYDSNSTSPKLGVLMWAKAGVANGTGTINGESADPASTDFNATLSPSSGYFTATRLLKVSGAKDLKVGNANTGSTTAAKAITDSTKAITAAGT